MKKIILTILAALTAVCAIVTMSACHKTSYGDMFESQEKLSQEMSANGLILLYPQSMGTDANNAERQYAAIRNGDSGKYVGYKIYCFGSPFYTSVTSFNYASDKLLSDSEERTSFLMTIDSDCGKIKIYSGKGHKDALYLIGCINVNSQHYEIRLTSDEEIKDNLYVHAIYKDNEYYSLALKTIADIAESLK